MKERGGALRADAYGEEGGGAARWEAARWEAARWEQVPECAPLEKKKVQGGGAPRALDRVRVWEEEPGEQEASR